MLIMLLITSVLWLLYICWPRTQAAKDIGAGYTLYTRVCLSHTVVFMNGGPWNCAAKDSGPANILFQG